MPTMAREFSRMKLIRGHVLQSQVLDVTTFIKQWPALATGDPYEAAQQIVRDVRKSFAERDAYVERLLLTLRTLAGFDARVWVLYARTARATGAPVDAWEEGYKRAVEAYPQRADLLWEWSDVSPSPDRQIALKVQAVEADSSNVAISSQVANLLNRLYATDRTRYPAVRWAALMRPVITALEAHIEELDGEALGRLAWLHIHAGRSETKAKLVVERGLAVDRHHLGLQKLARRLDVSLS
jgi:hypothetical protein